MNQVGAFGILGATDLAANMTVKYRESSIARCGSGFDLPTRQVARLPLTLAALCVQVAS